GGHGRVLPAGPGFVAAGRAGGQSGGVLADAPQPGPVGGVGDDEGGADVRDEGAFGAAGRGRRLGGGVPAELHVQPRAALGQVGDAGAEQFGVHALHGERAVRQELVGDLGGGVAVGAADEQQRPCRGGGHRAAGGGGAAGPPPLGPA